MSQIVEFNWGLKVKDPIAVIARKRGVEIKGGFRVIPMGVSIDLIDWQKNTVGKVSVFQVIVKRYSDLTSDDIKGSDFASLNDAQSYLKKEYPNENSIVTLITYEVC